MHHRDKKPFPVYGNGFCGGGEPPHPICFEEGDAPFWSPQCAQATQGRKAGCPRRQLASRSAMHRSGVRNAPKLRKGAKRVRVMA
ncbi:MAG: hypothetical protein IJ906_13555 [Oscillospiraceae bacterium]|nr:hypothetical protein [Oscillospiraceae bacterium]